MALGTLGSTLNDELNRLANGGTYRDMNQMVDEALAAKQWANRENINPYSTDTVGILNEIAGLGLDKKNWLDFNGVCNYIAGTTGLPAAAALRQVYPTTDLLTGVASYYIDATAPTNWGSLGYLRFPGGVNNWLSIPDSTALSITGDIDIRVKVALDDWTPAATNILATKSNAAGTSLCFQFQVQTDGTLRFLSSSNGTSWAVNVGSTVATGITDGTVKWVRATLDVDNGASGKDVKFWTSDDGSNWTQLGTTITSAGTTSIIDNAIDIGIGDSTPGNSGSPLIGNLYNVQIFASLDGTDKRLDVNIANDYKASNQSFFTATTGQTVTVNGLGTIANLGAAGSLLPTTLGSSTAADSNDPKFLDFTGTNYVYNPGVTGNNMSVPNSAALQITGDLDLRAHIAMDDWTPASTMWFVYKIGAGADGYALALNTNGTLALYYNGGGSNIRSSTVATGAADGSALWVRVTFDVDNGAGGNDVKFFTSPNGSTWTQLGATVTNAGTVTIATGTDVLSVTTNPFVGKMFRAQVFNGIDGTKVLDVDTSVITAGSATSFTAVTGQTVTINRSTSGRKTVAVTQPTWLFGTDDYMEVNNRYMSSGTYLYLPGVASNYASVPTSAALEITGDIDLRVKVALDDWTPSGDTTLIAKQPDTTKRCYWLYVQGTTGVLVFQTSTDGPTGISSQSSVATGLTDGSTKWVRATRVASTGVVKFFLSDDGTNWTQLGTDISNTSGNMFSTNTGLVEVGARGGGTASVARGKFFRAQVLNGIDGTVAFDANFETSITSLLQTSFTESSANAATVTINRSGSAYRSAGITTAGYLYPGATNTFAASATDFLNFGAADSFTLVAVVRQWATPTSFGKYIIKRLAPGPGYSLETNSTSVQNAFAVSDGTLTPFNNSIAAYTQGTFMTVSGVRNVTTDLMTLYSNTTNASITDTTTGSISNIQPLRINSITGSGPQDTEIYAAAVFRQALSAAQIRQISNYFANREVYL